MERKFMTSIKLSQEINNKMLHSVVEENSSLKGKSKWIIDAVENFLLIQGYPELVDIASEMEELTETVSLRIPEVLVKRLEEAVIFIRQSFPAMEGVKSNIIRASIIQKLLRQKA